MKWHCWHRSQPARQLVRLRDHQPPWPMLLLGQKFNRFAPSDHLVDWQKPETGNQSYRVSRRTRGYLRRSVSRPIPRRPELCSTEAVARAGSETCADQTLAAYRRAYGTPTLLLPGQGSRCRRRFLMRGPHIPSMLHRLVLFYTPIQRASTFRWENNKPA